ncbi:response regulator transcription factor [Thermomonospora umbrina]|uniref:LuxR family two component transcriptional regulator n=1 Tax=Thermomonospora umbrina TaxID=111806 RepID=A0A3D9STE6_9ACTN|nr:response regulator transcription factor [Thermomonospora umbrina]REE96245.1 LuxR family two component transcriptional regulator [Thermomonospora umbrina]
MITILLAEDVRMIRGALTALIHLEDDLRVVAETDRGDSIIRLVHEHRPDVAVIDIDLPGLDGLSAAAELREKFPDCRVLILTGLAQAGLLQRAVAVGAGGYLLKDAPPAELTEAIRKVAAGHRVFDPQLVLAASHHPTTPLTGREIEVLRLAAEGDTPHEIADRLQISVRTVRNHLTVIVNKLNARNRIDAVRIAREAGLLV